MKQSKKSNLIKRLLSDKLTPQERESYADLEPIKSEIKKQWETSAEKPVDLKIKEQIWKKVKAKCNKENNRKVHVGLAWYFAAASVAILLTIGGLWMNSTSDKLQIDELVKVIATQSRTYVLPDSTKVWMESGSSIQYSKEFNKSRKVWLSGNSLFEVSKHKGSTFQVFIDKAFIEVKGTCFLIKQNHTTENQIMLFHGKIEFCVENGQRTMMKPLQKMIYNPSTAQTEIKEITDLKWENGKYKFIDTPLTDLIQVINQMRDAEITIGKDVDQESAFTGSIRYDESLEDIISKICFSLNLKKEEKNNKIIIQKEY